MKLAVVTVCAAVGLALAAACASAPDGDAGDGEGSGVGEPCSSDGTFGQLCEAELVCLEERQGEPGGDCRAAPACAADDFCRCDLTSLCGGVTPTLCSVVDGARLVVCESA